MTDQAPESPNKNDKNTIKRQYVIRSASPDGELSPPASLSKSISMEDNQLGSSSSLSSHQSLYSNAGIPLRRSLYSASSEYSPVVEEFDRIEISPSLPYQNSPRNLSMHSNVTLTGVEPDKTGDKGDEIQEEHEEIENISKNRLEKPVFKRSDEKIDLGAKQIELDADNKPRENIDKPRENTNLGNISPKNTRASVKEMEEMLMKIQKLRNSISENGRLISRPTDIQISKSETIKVTESPKQVSSSSNSPRKLKDQVSRPASNTGMKKKLIHWMSQTKGHTPSSSISSSDLINIPPTPPLITRKRHSVDFTNYSLNRTTSAESSVYSQLPPISPSQDIEDLKSSIESYRQTLNALNGSDHSFNADTSVKTDTSPGTIRRTNAEKQSQTSSDTDTRHSIHSRRPYSLMSSAESYRTARSNQDSSPQQVTPLKTAKSDIISPTNSVDTAKIPDKALSESDYGSDRRRPSQGDDIRRISTWSRMDTNAPNDDQPSRERSISTPFNANEAKRAANRLSRSRAFSQANVQHLLSVSESSFQIDSLDIPPEERHLLERFVDALSKLSVEINMDEGKRIEGKRRLHNALRAIEGWI